MVTATYRDTQLMDTPLTITALTDIEIEQRGVEDITDLFLSVPGLNYGQAAPTWHYVVARGIAQHRSPVAPVSMYIDNTPVQGLGARSPQLPNFDLERIEVLKGPQGTLYGQGSMAAAVRYITKKPSPEGFDWAISARIENPYHSDDMGHRLDAMINFPLGDRVALRVTPYSRNKPGILDKYGPRIIPDVDFRDEFGFRAQLAWYANDRVTVNFTHHYVDAMHGAPGTAFHCFVEDRPEGGNIAPNDRLASVPWYPVTAGLAAGADWIHENGCEYGENGTFDGETARYKAGPEHVYVTHMASPQLNDGGWSKSWIYNLSLEWELNFADLTWSSGLYEHHIAHSEEQRIGGRFGTYAGGSWETLVNAACEEVGCPPGGFWGRSSSRAGLNLYDRFTHEVRLVSNTDSRLQWAAGAYLEESEDGDDPRTWGYCGATGPQSQQIFAGPDYPEIVCHGRNAGITYNPQMTLDQMRAVQRILQKARPPWPAGYHQREESAIFGEASYAISDRLDILAGVRFGRSKHAFFGGPDGRWVPLSEANNIKTAQAQTKAAPKVTLTWRPADGTMVYAMWATAFRGGGANSGVARQISTFENLATQGVPNAQQNLDVAQDLLTYEGDDMSSLEVGMKSTVLNGRLDFTLAAYRMTMDNAVVQIRSTLHPLQDPANPLGALTAYPISVSDNVGAAESRGLELEMRGQLTDSLSLRAGGSWIPDAEVLTQQVGAPIAGAGIAVNVRVGNRIRLTPVLAYFATLQYDFQIAGYDGSLRGDYYYRGKEVYRTENNERPTPTYGFLNAKLMFSRDNYEVGIYVNNVTDTIAPYSIGDSGYHGFHPPRSIGFEYRMNR